ncbi:poly-specific ribonuclease [Lichtheimia corymbifera JMRC:FSU:9682]|uniref:PAN2-PAN3 deadenylation complex subunit PAN3 n=1 Tax=Lichtheimia corymbifera JMRC:FSU:9682 TaxID=1263082 RepID=A0A068S726_9FUNG|nr:poly-specific ribonuclease [Lichtheimia corymbifera JMRC:FSU:9682]
MQQSDMHESKSRITSADSQSFGYTQDMSSMTNSFSNFGLSNDGSTSPEQAQSPTQMMATMGMMQADPYYYMNAPVFARQPLQYHLYASNAPPVSRLLPHHRTIQSFFMPDNLREELTQRNETTLMSAPAHDLGLPQEVHVYHSLYPLQHSQMAMPGEVSSFFGHPTSVYKAVSGADGRTYVLYRIEGFRLSKERAMSFVEQWRKVQHCNIISIHEAFTTRAFGDASLVFVYDYFPCARTLHDVYMTPHGQMTLQGELRTKKTGKTIVSEETIWSYIVQIVSAIKTAHATGLAIRSIDPSKILVTSKHRIRVNCVASLDVMDYETKDSVCSAENREQDFVALGKLILALACGSPMAHQHLPECIESISQDYSEDLKDVILYLITSEEEEGDKDVDELVAMIAPHVLDEIDRSQSYNDSFENELSRELENGRLVRLLIKMGFINERPEFDMDPSWSETGDRYIIKLFRDYVFHQVDENGTPVIDMVHVLTCLNKLDAGLDEKMMLMSRDEQSCLIVSYKEVKNCIIAAFKDLTSGRK